MWARRVLQLRTTIKDRLTTKVGTKHPQGKEKQLQVQGAHERVQTKIQEHQQLINVTYG